MKKFSLTVSVLVIAILVMSILAFQPLATEASNDPIPNATPSPRTKRKPARNKTNKAKVTKPRPSGAINGDDDWVRKPKKTPRTIND